MVRILSRGRFNLAGPGVNDGVLVEVIHGSDDAVLEFLFGCDADVAQDGAGELFASFHELNPVRLYGFPRQMNPRTIEQASWNRWSNLIPP
jgi:hypothetical protein